MTAIAAKQKQRKAPGKRRAAAEVAERVAFVRELVTSVGRDRAKLHEAFVAHYGDTPTRTVDEYLARVDRAWLRDAEQQAPDARTAFLAKLAADVKLYEKHKAWSAHAAARRLMARVEGLDAQQVAVTGSVQVAAGHVNDVSQLSPDQVQILASVVAEHRGGLPAASADAAIGGASGDSTKPADGGVTQ